ncbi:MAG: histidine kinase N-terminal 7TM domain-containing protein [Candidatus Aenigmatarchaeota archaeon]
MNFYSLLPLSGFLISMSLGLFALRANSRSRLNQTFALFMFSTSLWSISSFLIYNSPSPETAFLWDKTETFGSFLSASFMLHFCLSFTKSRFLKRKLFPVAMYMPVLFFTYVNVTTKMLTQSEIPSYWGYSIIPGELYYLFAAWITAYALASVFACSLFFLRSKSHAERSQALLLTAGILVMIIGGVASEVVAPMLGIEVMPLTSTLTAINGVFVAYAMLRYRLMALTPLLAAENILKTIADYLLVFNKDGTIAFLSDSAAQMLGKGKGAAGTRLDGAFPDGALASVFGRLEKDDTLKDMETTISSGAGKKIPVSFNCSVVKGAGGSVLGYVLVMRDVSRVNELVKSLKEKTAQLEKSKNQLEAKVGESERFNKLSVGRELKMVELKKRMAALEEKAGKR